ncbi:MAG: DEAD/DEAH box helicase [Chloroflexi bacterium]|nr:DEAD/DEAH box helicase [Chloroflexota bacterium]
MPKDILFWRLAATFGLDLLARQRFVPAFTISARGDGRTGWQPLFDLDEDRARLDRLAQGLPPVCRAVANAHGRPLPPVDDPRRLVLDFLQTGMEGLARGWLEQWQMRGSQFQRPRLATASERWASALRAGAASIGATAFEAQTIGEGITVWTAPLVRPTQPGGFRTFFQLEEPPGPRGEGAATMTAPDPQARIWRLNFLLQSRDDPDVQAPAAAVWAEAGTTLRFGGQRFEHAQERLLADLGRAARLFPPLEGGLWDARPAGVDLTTGEAYTFLKEATPLLIESGFGVTTPSWWDRRSPRLPLGMSLRLRGRGQTAASAGLATGVAGLDAIVEYEWQLALGDQELDREEFTRLVEQAVPLVQVRGYWIELRPDQVAVAQKALQTPEKGIMPLRTALRLALGAEEDEQVLPVLKVIGEGWLSQLVGGDDEPVEVPTPAGFHGTLRPYQQRGLTWLSFLSDVGLGALLADDMGLGKTIQAICLFLRNKEGMTDRPPVLLICPTSVVGNWRRECERFAPSLRVLVHHGGSRAAAEQFAREATRHDLVISTYGLAYRDEETLAGVLWDGVVLDEAQNVKNPATRQAQAVRTLKARYRVALTGTPVENRLGDLWSIMEFLNPGYLGTADAFKVRFAIPIERWRDTLALARLRRLVAPFLLRRLKTDPTIIADLPEKMEMKVYYQLTREQGRLYEGVVKDMLRQIEGSAGIQRRGLILATLTKLKQVCNHPAHYLSESLGSEFGSRSGKVQRLRAMLEEAIAEGDKSLIFTQFTEFGRLLQGYLEQELGTDVLFLHGGTSQPNRERLVERFQYETNGPPVFILSLRAGGTGLNLTAANHVFHVDRWWNPAVENQATDRAFRIGQLRNVQVHKFVCLGTLEDRIDQMIESKKDLAEQVVGAGESWLTELSTGELREVFSLKREAIEDE